MKIEKWIDKNTKSLKGKTVAITGSTGGLGRHVSEFLVKLGADLILLNRNEVASNKQKEELLKLNNDAFVQFVKLDMVDFKSVKEACEKLKDQKIDILILNAGAYSLPREKTKEGFDNVFQINFVSPYYIVKTLLANLREQKAKVVVVGSIAHKYSKIDEKDIDFSSVKAPRKVYGNAKRFLMFSLTKLLSGEENLSLSIVHPGITPTNITSHYSPFVQKMVKYPMKLIFSSPKKASLNIIKGIFENCPPFTWVGPSVCNIWGKPKLAKLTSCKNDESEKIFEIAENIYQKLNNC